MRHLLADSVAKLSYFSPFASIALPARAIAKSRRAPDPSDGSLYRPVRSRCSPHHSLPHTLLPLTTARSPHGAQASCLVSYDGVDYPNWAAFRTAHPGARIATNAITFIIVDQPARYVIWRVQIN